MNSDTDYDSCDEHITDEEENFESNYIKKMPEKKIKKITSPPHPKSKKILKKSNVGITKLDISTNGIPETQIQNIDLKMLEELKQCNCCGKYHCKNMILDNIEFGGTICKHCICWLNYNPDGRLDFDKMCDSIYNFNIALYILDCHKDHDTKTCEKTTDNGGCLLCDYILNLDIKNIMYPELLSKQTNKKEKTLQEFIKPVIENDVTPNNISFPQKIVI